MGNKLFNAFRTSLVAKRDDIKNDDKGFTLIELLVVVLIIGILAAIAIPVFLGQQEAAKDAAAKSDLANAKIALIAYQTENDGDYPTTPVAADPTLPGFTKSGNVTSVSIESADTNGFCIEAVSETTKTFSVTEDSAVVEAACGAAPVVP